MKTKIVTYIDASAETVFKVLADASLYKEAVPGVKDVEVVSDLKSGVGTRFIEIRQYGGKDVSHEMEITEYNPYSTLRIVSDSGGTVWDSLFELEESDSGTTQLILTMTAETSLLSKRIMNFLIKGMIKNAVSKDMTAVKIYCEKNK